MKRLGEDILLTPIAYLTKKERKRIVRTWIAVEDRIELVQSIYLDVFLRYPGVQAHFPRLARVPMHDLPAQSAFRAQCIAYGNFLDYMVGFVHLNSGNFIEDACAQLGRAHAEHAPPTPADRHFADEWWRAFAVATIANLKPHFGRRELRFVPRFLRRFLPTIGSRVDERAWTILLDHVVDYTRRGFEEAMSERAEVDEMIGNHAELVQKVSADLIRWLETAQFVTGKDVDDDEDNRSSFAEEASSAAPSNCSDSSREEQTIEDVEKIEREIQTHRQAICDNDGFD